MSNIPVDWAPGLIGFTVSSLLYGTTLGQTICYTYWFADDPWLTKVFVFVIFLADTAHAIGSAQLFWEMLVSCHRSSSWSCSHDIVWGAYVVISLNYTITFAIQCFYCRRIWAISEKNKPLALAIVSAAILGFVFGTWFMVDVSRVGTIDYLFNCPFILPFSLTSTLCDLLITSAVFNYMWRSGLRRKRSVIQDLAVVCINTGALTCVVSVTAGIVYLIQGNSYWIASVGIVISRGYVNSMLAVLNARKPIRDRDRDWYSLNATLTAR